MNKLYWLLSFIILSVLFFQCQKELHYIGGPDTGVSVTPDPIKASLQGNITDENDQPAAGVMVTAGASTAITDANGYFRFTDASLDKNTTLVTALKDGYFKGYRVFAATSGCNQVVIKLLKKDLAGTVASATGGEVALSNGSKVSLPAGGIVNASSNSDYSGDVKVYASYINPNSSDIGKTIPGSLVANDEEGKRVVLASYGMLAVELSSASGEKLQIKSGSMATLTIPIPAASVASAPATIPLWYVDETTGIWQEEGMATKQGSNYIGEVKHFSFWNCDYPFDAVKLSLTLQTPSGLPLIYSQVQMIATSTSDTGISVSAAYGYTDSLGQVEGMVPAGSDLSMKVMGNCGSVIYTQNIQPLTQDKDLGIIKITDNTSSLVTLLGTLMDCNNNPVTKGYVFISFEGPSRYVTVNSNGQFTTTYVRCSGGLTPSASILGVDETTEQQSDIVSITLSSATTDVGNITACGTSSEQYINYKLDGLNYSITSTNLDSLNGFDNIAGIINYSTIYGFQAPNHTNYISFNGWNTTSAGTYKITQLEIQDYSFVTLDSSSTVTFTNFPLTATEFYEGTMSSKFTDSTAVNHNLSASFRVRRNF